MTSNTLSILPEFEVFQFLIVLDLFIAFNLIPKKTPEVLFTSYMAFVLPTLYTRGSGNLTIVVAAMLLTSTVTCIATDGRALSLM